MEKKLNLKELKWVHQPDRFVVKEDKIIIETEPHTSLNLLGGSAEGKSDSGVLWICTDQLRCGNFPEIFPEYDHHTPAQKSGHRNDQSYGA